VAFKSYDGLTGLIFNTRVTIMVIGGDETRNDPEYSIARLRELAEDGCVRYLSTRVEQDIENLDFLPEDVHRCLARLENRHYQHSIKYAGRNYWLDIYYITCQGQTDDQDNLYIKLKLNRDCIWVELASFHRERR
jgi:motility quorum-sensing regulator / GCU-specific mRNA interferase toxin